MSHLFQLVKGDLEGLSIRRHHLQGEPRPLGIGAVFREEGSEYDQLIPRLGHRPQGMGQGPGGAAGHKDAVGGIGQAETAAQAFGHRLPHRGDAQGGAVAMEDHRVLFLQKADHFLGEGRVGGDAGVAQAVVKNVLVADLLGPLGAVLVQGADHGFLVQHLQIGLVQHGRYAPFHSTKPAHGQSRRISAKHPAPSGSRAVAPGGGCFLGGGQLGQQNGRKHHAAAGQFPPRKGLAQQDPAGQHRKNAFQAE